jgi:sugar lactone lactonase YvrE
MHRLDPSSGESRSWPMPSRIGSFGLRDDGGGAVVALVDGFHRLEFATGDLTFLAGPDPVAGTRFNDGKVSPDGRFFAGTMDEEQLSRPIAALYRLDPDGTMSTVVDGLIVSNGLAWSADGRTMFHSDSKAQVVWTYDYHPGSGAVGDRRVLARPTEQQGRPDGAATDEKGFYWSAGISAGVLNRWAPDGRLDRSIPLPCSNPTAPCFGGPDLRTIFITSLRHDLSADVLAEKPLSGGIFAVQVDVPGVPVAGFAG